MQTTLQVVNPPAVEPLSIDLVRLHARIDHSSDDLLLKGYLAAARTLAESYLSRALITQTLLWTIRPESMLRREWNFLRRPLELPRAPVQSIDSVVALDDLGNSTTISATTLPIAPSTLFTGYIADIVITPPQLNIGMDTVMSDGRTLRQVDLRNIQVQFIAGYGDDFRSVPQPIINAILLTTAFLYEHRGDAGGELPQAAQWLLDPYRLWFLGA